MILTKLVVILEFGKRFQLALKTLLVCHVAVMTMMWLFMKALQNLTLLEDISTKFIEINCLISSITVKKSHFIDSCNFNTNCNTPQQKVFQNLILVSNQAAWWLKEEVGVSELCYLKKYNVADFDIISSFHDKVCLRMMQSIKNLLSYTEISMKLN